MQNGNVQRIVNKTFESHAKGKKNHASHAISLCTRPTFWLAKWASKNKIAPSSRPHTVDGLAKPGVELRIRLEVRPRPGMHRVLAVGVTTHGPRVRRRRESGERWRVNGVPNAAAGGREEPGSVIVPRPRPTVPAPLVDVGTFFYCFHVLAIPSQQRTTLWENRGIYRRPE